MQSWAHLGHNMVFSTLNTFLILQPSSNIFSYLNLLQQMDIQKKYTGLLSKFILFLEAKRVIVWGRPVFCLALDRWRDELVMRKPSSNPS